MRVLSFRLFSLWIIGLLLSACATPAPSKFELVDYPYYLSDSKLPHPHRQSIFSSLEF